MLCCIMLFSQLHQLRRDFCTTVPLLSPAKTPSPDTGLFRSGKQILSLCFSLFHVRLQSVSKRRFANSPASLIILETIWLRGVFMSQASDERLQPLWSRADTLIIVLPLGSWHLCILSTTGGEREGDRETEKRRVGETDRERE